MEHSKSGWFDMLLFEQWFLDDLLPHVREDIQNDEQVDNLAFSHVSPFVTQTTRNNNIYDFTSSQLNPSIRCNLFFFGPMIGQF